MTDTAWTLILFAFLVILFLAWCYAYCDAPEEVPVNPATAERKVIGTKSVGLGGYVLGYYIDGPNGKCTGYYPNGAVSRRLFPSDVYSSTPLYSDDPCLLRKVW